MLLIFKKCNNHDEEIVFKLEYLFSKISKLDDGFYESKNFVLDLENYVLTPTELDNVQSVDLKKQS